MPTISVYMYSPTEFVEVDGPEMVKVLKSRRIWQMLLWHLQTVAAHVPAVGELESKYVQFSEYVWPHPAETGIHAVSI